MGRSKRAPKEPVGDDPLDWARYHWETKSDEPVDAFLAMSAVLRASSLIVALVDRVLKPYDLTRTSYLFLMSLHLSGAWKLSRISQYLLVHPTTVTMLADRLEARELVVREAHPRDRRATLCRLTADGEALAEQATKELAAENFGIPSSDPAMARQVFELMQQINAAAGDR